MVGHPTNDSQLLWATSKGIQGALVLGCHISSNNNSYLSPGPRWAQEKLQFSCSRLGVKEEKRLAQPSNTRQGSHILAHGK